MVCGEDNLPGYTGLINHSSKGSFPMQNRMMITGAGSGLGREIALRWAREGWQLALSDVNEPGLSETLLLVREAGGFVTDFRGGDRCIERSEFLAANDGLHSKLHKIVAGALR